MQHLGINFGGIWRFELGFLYLGISVFFCLRNLHWFLKVQLQHWLVRSIVSCFCFTILKADLQLSYVIRQLHIATRLPSSQILRNSVTPVLKFQIHCCVTADMYSLLEYCRVLIDGTVAMRLYRIGNCTQFAQQIVCWFGMLSIVSAVFFCHVNCGRWSCVYVVLLFACYCYAVVKVSNVRTLEPSSIEHLVLTHATIIL